MALNTYAALQASIASYLDRSDLTAEIVDFITLAEAKFNREIRRDEMKVRNDSFTVDSQTETVPTGFREAHRFILNTDPVTPLEWITPETLVDKKGDRLRSAGKPIYYTVIAGSFEFLPSPDSSYTASLLYTQELDGLATTDPNWLLTDHPDVYLYGALLEAEPFIMNDERLPVWQAMYDRAMAQLTTEGDNRSIGSRPVMRPRRALG